MPEARSSGPHCSRRELGRFFRALRNERGMTVDQVAGALAVLTVQGEPHGDWAPRGHGQGRS